MVFLLAVGFASQAIAQLDPRLTGTAMVGQLEAAQRDLSARAAQFPDPKLSSASQRLADLAANFRKELGNDADKPVGKLSDSTQIHALQVRAATLQAKAYLGGCEGCLNGDAAVMSEALVANIDLLIGKPSSSSAEQPVIDGIETLDHRPIFAVLGGASDVAIAITGSNFHDAKCDDPVVTATNDKGVLADEQPTVTSVLPNRIELKLPKKLDAGAYILHVNTKHKSRFVGCSASPEAASALQVAPPLKISAAFTLVPVCRSKSAGEHDADAIADSLPDITAYGSTVSHPIATTTCPEPVAYKLSAKATLADGSTVTAGPISQNSDAAMTLGIPGGLTMSFDPSVQTVFLKATATPCKGFY